MNPICKKVNTHKTRDKKTTAPFSLYCIVGTFVSYLVLYFFIRQSVPYFIRQLCWANKINNAI